MLFTVGYEGASLEAFIGTLAGAGVQTLVDVRERAQSRRRGYSKTALAEALAGAGIRYRHLRALGTPPTLRKPYKLDHDFAALARGYWAHLATQAEALEALGALVARERVCLLCFEADPATCHRSLIVERLRVMGLADAAQDLRVPVGA